MATPRVTVLMSVYNGEKYLTEAIDSIVNQTFADFEFIIINDGSTDNSICIIESYGDPRICLVNNDRNLGLPISLNRGFELARGEYIARMDADDISRPERLARQISFLDAHPQVGVCGGWVRFFPPPGSDVWKLPESSEEIKCMQFYTVGVAHPAVMMRKKFFTDNGLLYDPRFRFSQDYELWGRALQYMDFANIQEVLLDYRISSGQICSRYGSEQLAAVAPLRLQRVRELGIEPTPEEQLLHEMILNNAVPPEPETLDQVEQWLLRLESANRVSKKYSTVIFPKRLLDLWFSTCISSADRSVCSWQRCLSSPLWSSAHDSVWLRVRSFCAWVKRKGLRETVRGNRYV